MYRRIRFISVFTLITLLALVSALPAFADHRTPLDNPIPEPIPQGPLTIQLVPVAMGMTAPNWGTSAPGCASLVGRLFVVDQDGKLWRVNLGTGQKQVVLDVGPMLVSLGAFGPGTYDERGFLGVAFHPDYASNGMIYTYTSEPTAGPADFSTMPPDTTPNHQSVVREWHIPNPCSANSVVDPSSNRELLRIDEPQFNHNGGTLVFGPDGKLYISLGDGGEADDQGVGHVEGGNGQAPSNILGSVLRIDPQGNNSANGQYGIPADNPFVGMPGFLDEIYAYGFRNPFRISFDRRSGDLIITDVGQHHIEEINIGMSGGNYGWRIKEGSFCFDPNGTERGFAFECLPGDDPGGLIDPIAEYDHGEGVAIVGGFVYRGRSIAPLQGRYVFGDFFSPDHGTGRLFFLQMDNSIREFNLQDMETLGQQVLGFGEDAKGELYVMTNSTGVPFGETGMVWRIAATVPRSRNFRAHLSGIEEVPPVDTTATGQALFSFNADNSNMRFKLMVANIENVLAAHIHCAPAGVSGPVGVTLFSGGPVTVEGVLASGERSAPDAGNACGWTTLEQVRNAIESGNAYANVHTIAHPAGEIRGQIH
jgi:glucose/arabinose dehydrogenase